MWAISPDRGAERALERVYVHTPRIDEVNEFRRPSAGGDTPGIGGVLPPWARARDTAVDGPETDRHTPPRYPADNAGDRTNAVSSARVLAGTHLVAAGAVALWGGDLRWLICAGLLLSMIGWAASAARLRSSDLILGGRYARSLIHPSRAVAAASLLVDLALAALVTASGGAAAIAILWILTGLTGLCAANLLSALRLLTRNPAYPARISIDLRQEADTCGDPDAIARLEVDNDPPLGRPR